MSGARALNDDPIDLHKNFDSEACDEGVFLIFEETYVRSQSYK